MGTRRQKLAEDDPLTRAIAPPANETQQQREERMRTEQEAKRVSDAIDEELNKQRIADKKSPKPIKILLLGQSESGKSTTLKNFQLMHSPKTFRAEKAYWRGIIQINVVQSIHTILDLISRAHAASHSITAPNPSSANHAIHGSSSTSSHTSSHKEYPPLTAEHLKLKMRLAPLIQVEAALLRKILPPGQACHADDTLHEVCVNSSNTGWKGAFNRLLSNNGGNKDGCDSVVDAVDWPGADGPGVVLHACAEDMKRLWTDPIIKRLMHVEKMRPEEMAGLTSGGRHESRLEGIRRGRAKVTAAWAPYFDDMNAIIFLAPISCFDQVLQEDPSVNRLADSFLLWKTIVSHPLLKKTDLVLFLNKCDILRAKLESGIRLGDYITSYGNRPNDFDSASMYLKKKFAALMKEHAGDRPFYCHFTSVTDTKSTTLILQNVQDVIVRDNLKRSALVG
ncbi:hypothetical protein ID866_4239 [Astraeus odoratus]|nr:hypothetical protein ID866_4239 [Astraeus odoratus]